MGYFAKSGSALTIALSALLLTACGGGGSSSPTTEAKGLSFVDVFSGSVWYTDGTTEGTVKLSPDTASTTEGELNRSAMYTSAVNVKGKTFFVGESYVSAGVSKRALWSTQGTAASTKLLADLAPDLAAGLAPDTYVYRTFYAGTDYFYFLTNGHRDLWVSAGKANSTRKVFDGTQDTYTLSTPYIYGNDAYIFDSDSSTLYRYKPTGANSGTKTEISIYYSDSISGLYDSIQHNGDIYFAGRKGSYTYVFKLVGNNAVLHARVSDTDSGNARFASLGNDLLINIKNTMYDVTDENTSGFASTIDGNYFAHTDYYIPGSEKAFFYFNKNSSSSDAKIYIKKSLTENVLLLDDALYGSANLIKGNVYIGSNNSAWVVNLEQPESPKALPCTTNTAHIVGTLGDYVFIYNSDDSVLYKTKGVVIDESDVASISCERVYPAVF